MERTDLTIEILKSIRDEVRATREDLGTRIDATNARLDATNARLDETNTGLAALREQQVHSEIRLATELVALSSAVRTVAERLRDPRDAGLSARVEDHERRLGELEKRTG
jgi:hypothetical protein